MQKIAKNSPSAHHCTILTGRIFTTKACIDNRGKQLVKQQYLFHNDALTIWRTSAHWRLRSIREFGAPQQILTGFACWLQYRSDAVHRRPIKLCTICGRLLGWYTICTFLGFLPPDGILLRSKFTLHPSFALSYIGSVTARHSNSGPQSNCGVVQGMELRNLHRRRHLYSAGRPWRWALAHILVLVDYV